MLRSTLVVALFLAFPATLFAQGMQQPLNLLPQSRPHTAEQVPASDRPLLDEQSPSFQPMRSVEPEPGRAEVNQTPPEQPQTPVATAPVAQPAQPEPVAAQPQPQPQQPSAIAAPAPATPPLVVDQMVPAWALGILVLFGAFLAGLFGILTALLMRRTEMRQRRRAVAATLATELETRRLAFEAVPLPPNIEAGVSFVSSVTSLAGIESGFRAMQGNLNLLPAKVAANVSVHYAAVQRVSDFVKGQSLAAAVRMLQANRLGGHPCPDAGSMRDAHTELGAAFRGIDKLVLALRKQA